MTKSKKLLFLSLLTITCFAAGTLTSCDGYTNINGPQEIAKPNYEIPTELTSDPVEINFYTTMGQDLTKVFNSYLPQFNALYPNIKVTYDSIGGYDDVRDQITTELSAGSGPDLAYCYPDHVALYNKAGAVVRLDNLIADPTFGLTEAQINDFIPGYYEEGRSYGDGAMYTLPFSKSTEVLYYNKTFFDKNNLTVPTTWDEMEAVCRQIKQIDPTSTPLGYDSESNWFITMCEQLKSPYTSAKKGEHFLFDNPTNREFVKRFRGWYKEGLLTTQALYGSYTSGLFVNTAEDTNKSYMSIGSSAGATHQRPAKNAEGNYPFEVGIASIPQADANNKKVISQGPSLCLFKNKDPQKTLAAWLLMKFMTTNVAFQAEFANASGYIPAIQSVSTIPTFTDKLANANGGDNIAYLSMKVCMEQTEAYYTSPAFVGSSKAREEVGNIIVKVLGADITANDDQIIDKAFKDAIAECEYSI